MGLVAGGDTYLGPFSKVQIPDAALTKLLEPVWSGAQPLATVERQGANIATGFEIEVKLKGTHGGQDLDWTERRLIVCSRQHAQAAHKAFEARLAQRKTS